MSFLGQNVCRRYKESDSIQETTFPAWDNTQRHHLIWIQNWRLSTSSGLAGQTNQQLYQCLPMASVTLLHDGSKRTYDPQLKYFNPKHSINAINETVKVFAITHPVPDNKNTVSATSCTNKIFHIKTKSHQFFTRRGKFSRLFYLYHN